MTKRNNKLWQHQCILLMCQSGLQTWGTCTANQMHPLAWFDCTPCKSTGFRFAPNKLLEGAPTPIEYFGLNDCSNNQPAAAGRNDYDDDSSDDDNGPTNGVDPQTTDGSRTNCQQWAVSFKEVRSMNALASTTAVPMICCDPKKNHRQGRSGKKKSAIFYWRLLSPMDKAMAQAAINIAQCGCKGHTAVAAMQ